MSSRIVASLLSGASLLAWGGAAVAAPAPSEPSEQPPAVETVIVTAPREEVKARQTQFAAPNLINVQSAETIAKYPDFNAAEALGRIPGVSLSSDTGEGRFVNIRGLDANLNGATYGSVVLLNTNPGGTAAGGGGRAVEFDTIPTGAIDGIIVTKTLSPDHEAEGLGGSVELTPRQAASITKPFADVTLGYGYEPLHDHGGPFNAEVALGARFGFSNGRPVIEGMGEAPPALGGWISNPTPFSFVLTYSKRDDRRGVDDLEQGYQNDPTLPANTSSGFDLRRYDYHRRRFGYGGEFDFTPNENHRYYVRADVAGYTESVHKNFLLFRGDLGSAPTLTAGSPVITDSTQPEVTLTDEQETHRNQVYVAGGQDQFGQVVLDYRVAYSRATFNVGRNIGATFAGPNVPLSYDNTTNVDYPTFSFPSGFNVNDATAYNLKSINNSNESDRDEERTYAVNLLFPSKLFGEDDRIKIGVQARIRDKVVDPSQRLSYGNLPSLLLSDASTAPNTYYDGHYSNGPLINLYTIRSLVGGAQGVTNSGFTPDQGGFSRSDENIYAGYAQYDARVGKFEALLGFRVESTDATYKSFQFYQPPADAEGNLPDPTATLVGRKSNYTNLFPTVQLRYEITPKFLVRLSVSTGIGRPGFNQAAASTSIDASNPGIIAVSRGNPDLRPTTGVNTDLDFEYYLPHGGIFEVGLFDKEFENYIVQRVQNRIPVEASIAATAAPQPGDVETLTTYLNIPAAYARGIEAAYNQKFDFLPGVLKGLGIEANVTYVDSQILEYTAAQTGTTDQFGLLPGTSRLTWNLAGFYEAYALQARIAAEYVSPSLFGLGGAKAFDTIQDERLTLDFTSSYQLPHGVSVYFNAKNLLDTPLRYYQGNTTLPIQREFYDVTLEGGVRYRF